MRVTLFNRKPGKNHYSIERVFDLLAAELRKEVALNVGVAAFPSTGLLNRIKTALQCRALKGDMVHITGDIYFAAILSRKKTVITYHDLDFINRASGLKKSILKFFWLTLPVKKATAITTISSATRNDLLRHFPNLGNKIRVIYNPVEAEEPVESETADYFLLIGTKHNKNIRRQVMALVKCSVPIVIIGAETAEIRELISAFPAIRLYSNLSRTEYNNVLAGAYGLCFCSLTEGFGVPIVEAQRFGVPVITSDCSSMPEVAGTGALYADPLSVEHIADQVRLLKDNLQLRNELIQLGLENSRRFHPAGIAAQYLSLYRTVYES